MLFRSDATTSLRNRHRWAIFYRSWRSRFSPTRRHGRCCSGRVSLHVTNAQTVGKGLGLCQSSQVSLSRVEIMIWFESIHSFESGKYTDLSFSCTDILFCNSYILCSIMAIVSNNIVIIMRYNTSAFLRGSIVILLVVAGDAATPLDYASFPPIKV